jgi:HEAT repeat protein
MGLFDFLTKSKTPANKPALGTKDLQRLTRVISSKLSQDYDRQEAIAQLSAMANAEGARVLLKRFDFSMDPSITDHEEKEAAAAGVVAAGKAALGPVRDYISRAESVTWPLKILRQIVEPEDLADELIDLLEQFDTEYVRNSEPKIQLINALEAFRTEDVRAAIAPFIQDVNENVRFHAVGTLFAQADESTVAALVNALVDEESLRVKNRIAGGIEQRRWAIPAELREKCAAALPDTFALDGEHLLRVG